MKEYASLPGDSNFTSPQRVIFILLPHNPGLGGKVRTILLECNLGSIPSLLDIGDSSFLVLTPQTPAGSVSKKEKIK